MGNTPGSRPGRPAPVRGGGAAPDAPRQQLQPREERVEQPARDDEHEEPSKPTKRPGLPRMILTAVIKSDIDDLREMLGFTDEEAASWLRELADDMSAEES